MDDLTLGLEIAIPCIVFFVVAMFVMGGYTILDLIDRIRHGIPSRTLVPAKKPRR